MVAWVNAVSGVSSTFDDAECAIVRLAAAAEFETTASEDESLVAGEKRVDGRGADDAHYQFFLG